MQMSKLRLMRLTSSEMDRKSCKPKLHNAYNIKPHGNTLYCLVL